MNFDFVARLRCPDDRSPLRSSGEPFGALECLACSRSFPLRDGIPQLLPASLVGWLDDPSRIAPADETERALCSEMRVRDDEAAIYDEIYSDRAYRHELETYVRQLAVRSDETVLDLGCGTGRVTKEYLSQAAGVVGADLSMDSLRVFANRLEPADAEHVTLVRCEASHLPFANDSFDVVVSTSLFSNLPDEETRNRALAELTRVLAPGGRAMITVYHHSWIKRARHRLGISSAGAKQGSHSGGRVRYYNFDPGELRHWVGTRLVPGPCFGLNHRVPVLSASSARLAWRLDRWLDRGHASLRIFAAEMGVVAVKPTARQRS